MNLMNAFPEAIGPYTLIRLIARGGMGSVYLAQEQALGRYVALKVLDADAADDSEFAARFRREGHTVATLNHPHIVKVFDVGYDSEQAYIAMEYLNYGSLKDRLARYHACAEQMPMAEALEIARQIAMALAHAHNRGLIHRDVKPSNIMLATGGRYVLTDFGIVYLPQATRLTREPGRAMGTAEYISPEQIDQKPFDLRVDIYALGVVLYEMLTSQPPFSGEVEMVVLYQHVHQAPPALATLRPDAPVSVCRLIERALAKDPADRFSNADEMAAALEAELNKIEQPPANLSFRASARNLLSRGWRRPSSARLKFAALVFILISIGWLAVSQWRVVAKPWEGSEPSQGYLGVDHVRHPPSTKIYLGDVHFVPTSKSISIYAQPAISSSHQLITVTDQVTLTIVGRSRDTRWLYVQLPSQTHGWVDASTGRLAGKLNAVPELPVPRKENSK